MITLADLNRNIHYFMYSLSTVFDMRLFFFVQRNRHKRIYTVNTCTGKMLIFNYHRNANQNGK